MEWGELPSVVLLEIYEYLSVKDRLAASVVCRNWRAPVFQVPLSNDELVLKLCAEADIPQVKFLARNFAVKVQEVSLTFDASSPNCLDLVEEILGLLEDNTQLKSFKVRFSEESLVKNIFGEHANTNTLILRNYFIKKVLEPLNHVLTARNCLETFSFPFIQELAPKGCGILTSLAKSSKIYSIKNLFLATVRNVPAYATVGASLFSAWDVNSFGCLQMLSLDHDVLSDSILATLGIDNRMGGLKRLNLTAVQGNSEVSNAGWSKFVANNPACGVRLIVAGRRVMLNHSSNLLFPATPVTHFRAMYCKGIRMACMNSLIRWNEKTLEHLELIDESYDWMEYMSQAEEIEGELLDPFIYAAWKCPKLHTIKIGFLYCGHNLVGIARLKGASLHCLEIGKSQIVYHNVAQLSQEISKALGRKWRPSDDITATKSKAINSKIPKNVIHTARALYEDEA